MALSAILTHSRWLSLVTVSALTAMPGWGADLALTIQADKAIAPVSPIHHGMMTEEINHCYDGGLYAELVQNRVFKDDAQKPVHWSVVQDGGAAVSMALDQNNPLNDAISTSLRVDVTTVGTRGGIANDGYWGIPVKPMTTYRASFYARTLGDVGPFTVAIEHGDGSATYASAVATAVAGTTALNAGWKHYEATLTTQHLTATPKGRLTITVAKPGSVWFTLVSLFPPTWNNRANGLRPDLMQMMADLKPKFLRFPGGNYLEGDYVHSRFEWKKTLGDLSRRPGHPGCWEYRSSDGMGLLEFLLWCEDLKMEPVLGVYAGYSLKKAPNNPVQAGPELEPFIQDALDEIEYITGATTTTWGARRAQDGHPAPFTLRFVEIGNEDFFSAAAKNYDARFTQMRNAIKAKHPDIQCISSIGFEHPDKIRVHSSKPDLVDEHYYASTDEFALKAMHLYESYDRVNGPRIFVGEWAAHEDAALRPWKKQARTMAPTPNLWVALGDAAWMTQMERNADLVVMQCYAPLFVNVNPGAWQWRPDLIGYDNLTSYGLPSYYAIKLFSNNLGDGILKTELTGFDAQQEKTLPLYTSATKDATTGHVFLKLVNLRDHAQAVDISVRGLSSLAPTATAQVLTGAAQATNTLTEPTNVVPVTSTITGVKPTFTYTVPPFSLTVITF